MTRIAIISALAIELAPLLAEVKNKRRELTLGDITFYSGSLPGIKPKIYFCSFGIGKILASLTTQRLIDAFHPDHIYLIGACGGARTGVYPGDIIVAENTAQADFDITCFGFAKGEFHGSLESHRHRMFNTDHYLVQWVTGKKISGLHIVLQRFPRIRIGLLISQDTFETNAQKIDSLEKDFAYNGIDMEAAAVNIVARFNNIPFNVIKSILDKAGSLDMNFYIKYMSVACQNSYTVLKTFLLQNI